MKKNIFKMLSAIAIVTLLASCSEDNGQAPGADSQPRATLYTYAAAKPYNADNDVQVRVAANSVTKEAYFLYEKKADADTRIQSMGEDGYADYVVQNGQKLSDINGVSIADLFVTDLYGAYTIAVAAVNGSSKHLSLANFVGLEWDDVTTGTYQFGIMGDRGWDPVQTTLQVCTTDKTLYRFKDLFGAGSSLKIRLLPDYQATDNDGTYTFCRVPVQGTGRDFDEYGEVSVRDIGYWQGSDAWITDNGYESGMYEDYSCFIIAQWFCSAGNLGYNNYDFFIPNN